MKVVIIGGGAAGMMAAANVNADEVILLERNDKLGKKIYITGKGRCNLTNLCEPKEFISNVVSNPKFTYGAIFSFTPMDAVEFFNSNGCKTKVERGNRVFPISDKASDVTKALECLIYKRGVDVRLSTYVNSVEKKDQLFYIQTNDGEITCDRLVLACGGASYRSTGSDGSGYSLAQSLGHKCVEPHAALCSLVLKDDVSMLQGLSLKNVSVTARCDKLVRSEFGEMLFTDQGVSGPIILTLSSYLTRINKPIKLFLDLKPALNVDKLDRRVLSDFEKYSNKQLKNALYDLLPRSIIPFVFIRANLDKEKFVNNITKEERARLVSVMKCLEFDVKRLDDLNNAIVTSGGVQVSEVNPSTMESKLCSGLYMVGELLDIDALTGGFNLQLAWSTAYLAAKSIGE